MGRHFTPRNPKRQRKTKHVEQKSPHPTQSQDGYSRVIFKINNDREKRDFLVDFLLEHITLKTTFPAFMLKSHFVREYSAIQRYEFSTVSELTRRMFETESVPSIVKWVERSHEIVVCVEGSFNSHWFQTLINTMHFLLGCNRHTHMAIVYANGFTKKGSPKRMAKKKQSSYANRPKSLQCKRR